MNVDACSVLGLHFRETATRPSQGSKKAPPVMAKKASRRKISVAGTALVQTSRASKDYTRSGSFGGY